MDGRRRLLWIDGLAGAVVGVLLLLTSGWLAEWYRLPHGFLLFMGGVNVAYGSYSLTLARLKTRPAGLIVLLVVANLTWSVLCMRWAVIFWNTASPLGLAHVVAEGLFVGGLAVLEWRWRHLLQTNSTRSPAEPT